MVASNWVNLRDQVVGQKYRLLELLFSGYHEAIFTATEVGGLAPENVVVAVSTRKLSDTVRLSDLHHPNLRHVFASGIDTLAGNELWYAAMESVGPTLEETLKQSPLDTKAAQELAADLIAGLDYLHGRGLVYCGLKPATIARGESGWVLSDYILLRREGSADPRETRLLLAASPHVPPDAFHGIVTPAWDIWSLGVTLNQAFSGEVARTDRKHRPPPAPPPFDEAIRRSMAPDLAARIGLRELAGILGLTLGGRTGRAVPPPIPMAPAPMPVEHPSVSVTQKRRSRVYTVPQPQAEATIEPPAKVSDAPGWGGLGANARLWATVAFVVVALLAGALLARRDGDDRQQVVQAQNGADRMATRPVVPVKPRPAEPSTREPTIAERRSAVFALLDEWVTTTRNLDVDGHVQMYAPVMEVFYRKKKIPVSEVRREKAQLFGGLSSVRELDVRDITIDSLGREKAVVSFRKDWDMLGRLGSSGSERQRLTLRWIDNGWRISGEQEIRVYWSRK